MVDAPFATDGTAVTVESVSAMIRSYCRWHIAPSKSETFTLDGSGGRVLMLPTMHLTAVTSVTEDGTLVDGANYEWSQAGFLTGRCWSCKPRSVAVVATHGYETVPDELAQLTLQVVERAAKTPLGPTQESAGGVSISWGPGGMLSSWELAVLDRYRLPPEA